LEHQLVARLRDLSLEALRRLTLFSVGLLLRRLLLGGTGFARALLTLLSEELNSKAAQTQY